MECRVCALNATEDLPLREDLWPDREWRVATAFGTSLAGWLVVLPRRHVEGLHELSVVAAARLGQLVRAASVALVEVTGCPKTYVALLAEGEGFAHLHVHVVPRPADLPHDRQGPRVFGHLGAGPDNQVGDLERDALADRLAPVLARELDPGRNAVATPPPPS